MNDKTDYLSIAFYIALGIAAVKLYDRQTGATDNKKQMEDRLDDARVTLHNFIDDFTEGQLEEKEIEKTVMQIIR